MWFLRLLAWSLITAAVLVAGLGGAGYWLYRDATASGPLAESRTLVIPQHSGVTEIGGLLADQGVVRNPLTFEVLAWVTGKSRALKPGEFEFPAAASAFQALEIIAGGRTVKHRLTVPEGLTSAEVVALVRQAPALDGDPGPPPPEGTLFPDTYVYSYGDSREGLLQRMRHAMTHVVSQLWAERRSDLPFTEPQEAVILASIVEKETPREEERPHIAGVYINRLRLGMRLQADPTVLFALGQDGASKIDRPLTHADLSVNSPYNTYVNKGLPPGPIANPGRAALRAAMRPERTEDLYFVADGTGGHVFSKTLADQTRNVTQLRHASGGAGEAPALPAAAEPVPDPSPAPEPPTPHAAAAKLPTPTSRTRVAQQAVKQRHCQRDAGHGCVR